MPGYDVPRRTLLMVSGGSKILNFIPKFEKRNQSIPYARGLKYSSHKDMIPIIKITKVVK
jgi:hypothetical protein